jgi:hypothetical protein
MSKTLYQPLKLYLPVNLVVVEERYPRCQNKRCYHLVDSQIWGSCLYRRVWSKIEIPKQKEVSNEHEKCSDWYLFSRSFKDTEKYELVVLISDIFEPYAYFYNALRAAPWTGISSLKPTENRSFWIALVEIDEKKWTRLRWEKYILILKSTHFMHLNKKLIIEHMLKIIRVQKQV